MRLSMNAKKLLLLEAGKLLAAANIVKLIIGRHVYDFGGEKIIIFLNKSFFVIKFLTKILLAAFLNKNKKRDKIYFIILFYFVKFLSYNFFFIF